jgi:hypothetical protein
VERNPIRGVCGFEITKLRLQAQFRILEQPAEPFREKNIVQSALEAHQVGGGRGEAVQASRL